MKLIPGPDIWNNFTHDLLHSLDHMEEKRLYKITVKGHVQGVGFRWSAFRQATDLGLNGYVRNMSDGSVYIEAEGSSEQLEPFIEWCRQGPGFGYVEEVEIEKCPAVNHTGFRIER
jgi:acylphosphatase